MAQLRAREAALLVASRKSDDELKTVAYAAVQTSGEQGRGKTAARLHRL